MEEALAILKCQLVRLRGKDIGRVAAGQRVEGCERAGNAHAAPELERWVESAGCRDILRYVCRLCHGGFISSLEGRGRCLSFVVLHEAGAAEAAALPPPQAECEEVAPG